MFLNLLGRGHYYPIHELLDIQRHVLIPCLYSFDSTVSKLFGVNCYMQWVI